MNLSEDDTDAAALWRLSAEQREQIYEDEKRRIKHDAPTFSKKTKIITAVYILGCLLLYFGVTNAVIEL